MRRSTQTVVLACCLDSTKLFPMLIFKCKTLPKVIFPPSEVVQKNGWMKR